MIVTSKSNVIMKIEIVTLDSCEYLIYAPNSFDNFLTHKGNCKYCKQRNSK